MPLYTQRWKDTSIPDELHTEILTLKEYNANTVNKQISKKIHSSESENNFEILKKI